MIKRESYPAAAQKRILFLHWKIGKDLVAAYIKRTQGHITLQGILNGTGTLDQPITR